MVTITHEPIPGFPPPEPDPRAVDLATLQAAHTHASDNPTDNQAQEAFRAAYAVFYERYLKE
jgi:hypothetical protein